MHRRPIFRSFLRQIHRRPVVITLTCLLALGVWGAEGTSIIGALNPKLGRELAIAAHPPLSVWITPPGYSSASPMIISTPAGVRFDEGVIDVPQGSMVSAHLAEQEGDAPELVVDGDATDFVVDEHGDYAAVQELRAGHRLAVRRGWLTLASWKINVIADRPPSIALTEPPLITESKTLRLAYSASDDFGIKEVAVRITPHNPSPGFSNAPVEIPLSAAEQKNVTHVEFEDLTARPWAGQKVTIQLVATNNAGTRSLTDGVEFLMPERSFFHPVARLLIEERKKLLLHPNDEALRDETANVMASVAHETADYHGDPVVLMALRSGAVRLILAHDLISAVSVNDLLWQAATRIEDGNAATSQKMLRDAREDLARAVDHDAGQEEIQELSMRLQHALGVYLARFSGHIRPQGFVENEKKAHDVR